MSTFSRDECFQTTNSNVAFITFHLDEHRRRAFNANQLITFALEPNLDKASDENAPAQQLTLQFATADVSILGWRLDYLAEKLADNKLSSLSLLPKRYADLDRGKVFVSAIAIKPIEKM